MRDWDVEKECERVGKEIGEELRLVLDMVYVVESMGRMRKLNEDEWGIPQCVAACGDMIGKKMVDAVDYNVYGYDMVMLLECVLERVKKNIGM